MNFEELKQILFQEITNKKYKGELLINIFVRDSAFINRLVREGSCSQEALEFLNSNNQKITDIFNQVSIPYFKNAKYEELLSNYCEKKVEKQLKSKEVSDDSREVKRYSNKIASPTRDWLLTNWNLSVPKFLEYLIEETKFGRIAWLEANSRKAFSITLDEHKSIKLKRSEKNNKVNFLLIRKVNGSNKKDIISEADYNKLYFLMKSAEYIETEVFKDVSNKIEESAETESAITMTNLIYGKIDSDTRAGLESNWYKNAHTFMSFLTNQTQAGKIKWVKSKTGKSFKIVLDNHRAIRLMRSGNQKETTYSLVRVIDKNKKKDNISEIEFDRLYTAIKHIEQDTKKVEIIYRAENTNVMSHKSIHEESVAKRKNKKKELLTQQKIQERDKNYGGFIKKTYAGKMRWSRVENSSLQGNVYITSDNRNKFLLHCCSDNEDIYRFYMNGENLSIGGLERYLEKAIKETKPKIISGLGLSEYCSGIKETKPINKKVAPKPEVVEPAPTKRRVNIGIKDLVVRRNIFKCMHNKHSIEDVDAVVKIMNKNIEMEEVVVLAGYCKQCKVFFILESTYQQLRKRGVVAFRTVDEKNYLSQTYLNGKLLAKESILMQFGYTVSQTEGLSEARRHKILSVLVDNHILTKSEIISYLDFFINQRKSDKFAMAVAKWTIDRNYIRNYRIGEYSKIGVVYKNE